MATPAFALTPCPSPLSSKSNIHSGSAFFLSTSTATSPHSHTTTTNRHSFPSSNTLWQKHQLQMQQQQQQEQQQQQQQLLRREEIYLEKPSSSQQLHQQQQLLTTSAPSTPSFKPQAHTRPRLSLDTSQERLALADVEVIKHGDKSYLKLFSPILVESPVSFLNESQQREDKMRWENGPDEAFQRQLEKERREAFKARSKQQLRGFIMGLWLGCLLGLVIVQQTASKVYIPSYLARRETSPLLLFVILMTCLAVIRSGTRFMMTAIATSIAVVTCFATFVMNQSRYSTEFRVYRAVQARSYASSSSSSAI